VSVFKMLSDAELTEAIDRLSRLVEKLGRAGTWIAREQAAHYRAALDEAQAERERRQRVPVNITGTTLSEGNQ
jgi:hypothetical protein